MTKRQKARAILLSFLVVSSVLAGAVAVSAYTGSPQYDFETGDFSNWGTVGASWSISSTGAPDGTYWAHSTGGGDSIEDSFTNAQYDNVTFYSEVDNFEGHRIAYIESASASTASQLFWDTNGVNNCGGAGYMCVYDGAAYQPSGLGNFISAGTTYEITINYDWANSQYSLTVWNADTDTKVGTSNTFGFVDAVSDIGYQRFYAYSSGDLWVDNIAYNSKPETYPVSGTVKDANGDAVGSATVEVVETGATTTSAADGSYSFDLTDGDYTIEATKTGYNSGSTTVSVAGSGVTGANITISKDTITGQVTNQEGQPIANATVEAYIAEWSDVPTSKTNLESLEDPIPQAWRDLEDNPDLLGDHWSGDNTESYVSTHTKAALPSTSPWLDSANLDGTATVDLPANEPIILAAWNADATGTGVNSCIPVVSNEYDCQMTGEHRESATIVIERIGSSGDIVERSTVELDETSGGGYADPDDFQYAKLEAGALTPGFYYIHERGAPRGVPRKVGTMTGMIDRFQEDVEGALSEHAKTVKDYQDQGKITRVTAKTDENGRYSLDIATTAKVVTVQAYHSPALVDDAGDDPTAITQNDIVSKYNGAIAKAPETRSDVETSIANSSVYFPSVTKQVEPPSAGVDLELVEVGAPPGANTTAENEDLRALIEELRNKTFSEVTKVVQQEVVDEGIESLRAIYSQLVGTVNQYDPVKERYLELSERETVAPASELSKSELRTEIGHLNTALYSADLTGPITPPDPPEYKDDTISTFWEVPGVDLGEANVSVMAHWSNGTSHVVDEKYIKKDTAIGTDTVRLEKFPIGASDPAAVQFSLRVATADEYRERDDDFKNPTFSGELPRLQSIALSSMEPGPNENVSVTVSPAEVGAFKQVKSATVYGPDGNTIATSPITDGRKLSFTTNGAGIHRVELVLETTGGETVTMPVRVRALETDQNGPPMVTVRTAPGVGKYALAGNGLSGAEIRTDDGNQRATVVAQLREDASIPNNLQVHLEEYALAGDVETDIRVVRGSGQEAVSSHVPVNVHYRATGDDVLVWRNDRPITQKGTQYGRVRTSSDLTVVETYTDGSGSVSVKKVNDPTFRDRLDHRLDRFLLSVPFSITIPMPLQQSVVSSTVLELATVVDVLGFDLAIEVLGLGVAPTATPPAAAALGVVA